MQKAFQDVGRRQYVWSDIAAERRPSSLGCIYGDVDLRDDDHRYGHGYTRGQLELVHLVRNLRAYSPSYKTN